MLIARFSPDRKLMQEQIFAILRKHGNNWEAAAAEATARVCDGNIGVAGPAVYVRWGDGFWQRSTHKTIDAWLRQMRTDGYGVREVVSGRYDVCHDKGGRWRVRAEVSDYEPAP